VALNFKRDVSYGQCLLILLEPGHDKYLCLDGGRISARIVPFGLVIENSVRLVTYRET
jgi:hypothetical protein